MKKLKIGALLCALCALLALPAWAADAPAQRAADALHTLGLFQGVGVDAAGTPVYELDRAPTRAEALAMLIRALGRESEAKAGVWHIPFTDVEPWAMPYVGYAWSNGMTTGVSATRFDPKKPSDAAVYLTFMLRALGYRDGANGDFVWDSPFALATETGILRVGVDTGDFRRGDAALVTWYALSAARKGESTTLLRSLTDAGAVTREAAEAAALPETSGDPRSDAFSLYQSDNFYNGGIVAWDGGESYFITRTVDGSMTFELRRVSADGTKQTLYKTDGTRLSKLSVHDGKLYFCEDTTVTVDAPRYSLMVCDPADGSCREIWHSIEFSDYFWYDDLFYILEAQPESYRKGYSSGTLYALRAVTPEGRSAGTVAEGIGWREQAGFRGWGWDGALYWLTTTEPTGTALWRYELQTRRTTRTVLADYLADAAFESGALYTLSWADDPNGPTVISRMPLADPSAAERIATVSSGEAGTLLLRSGTLYFAGNASMKFYAVGDGGLRELFSTGRRSPSVSAFADKVIVSGDLFTLSQPDWLTLYDLTTMKKISFISWLDQ